MDNIKEMEDSLEKYKKDLDFLKTELAKQQGIKESLLTRLNKEFGIKNPAKINEILNDLIDQKEKLLVKINTIKSKIEEEFSEVLTDE